MLIILILPSLVPIITRSFWKDEATSEQISTLLVIFLSKNRLSTLLPVLTTCHTLSVLSSPHVITLVAFLLMMAPVTGVSLAGRLYRNLPCSAL